MIAGLDAPARSIIARLAAEELPADLALMQLILISPDEAAFRRAMAMAAETLGGGTGEARLAELVELHRRHPDAFHTVRATAAAVPHDGREPDEAAEAVALWAERFDAAARVSPEASVALYSLGDPKRLAASTSEIVEFLRGEGLLGGDVRALDLGCGIGRMEVALAGEVESIVGIDVSPEMVAVARRRSAGLERVEIQHASGLDLAPFSDARFDLVLAIDTLPYCLAGGGRLVAGLFSEIARVLAPGGTAVVINYSYRGDLKRDRADVAAHARSNGLEVRRLGERLFSRWDGAIFMLQRPAG